MSIFGNLSPLGKVEETTEVYTHQPDHDTQQIIEDEPEDRNFHFFSAVVVIFAVLLVWRLLSLQILQGQKNLGLAEGNRIRLQSTTAPRGLITDSFGEPLLKNVGQYDLTITPSNLPRTKKGRQKIYDKISSVTGMSLTDVIKSIDKVGFYSLTPITVRSNIPKDQALTYQVKLQDEAGVAISQEPVREYTDGAGLGHVLGYIGKISADDLTSSSNDKYRPTDWIGRAGLEKQYETYLKGKDGQDELEVNASGQLKRIISSKDPVQGDNLKLNLDLRLQQATYVALQNGINSANDNPKIKAETGGTKISKGVAIAFNPKDGAIYSFVSFPDYNPNIFINGDNQAIRAALISSDQVLLNRAVSGTYPPGSTIKPTYADAALEEKTITSNTSFDTPPYIMVGSFKFPDWTNHSGKLTDVKTAIAQSNDIFFYALAGGYGPIKGLGVDKMDEYLNKFGFNSLTGIDLPNEAKGLVPTAAWKKKTQGEDWYIGDSYHMGIGQGYLTVTPIQLVSDLSAIINDGTLVVPHLGKEIDTVDGKLVKKIDPAPRATNIANPDNLAVVRAGMRQTVTGGSAQNLQNIKGLDGQDIAIAGKTGTAQTGQGKNSHAWFVGYAPYDNPKVGVVVLVENGYDSYSVANPIAGQIFQNFFRDDNPNAK